jgi:hypothetical protein
MAGVVEMEAATGREIANILNLLTSTMALFGAPLLYPAIRLIIDFS